MKSFARIVLPIIALGALALSAPSLAGPVPDPIQFYPPQFVVSPKPLLGDAGDGRCPSDPPNQPCLKNVDDLLFGRTHVLRSDDLVLGTQTRRTLLFTQNSDVDVNKTDSRQLHDSSLQYTWPAVTGARMFNIGSDVAVSLVADRANNLLKWQLDGSSAPIANGSIPYTTSLPDPYSVLSVVAGDFTGDGLDEIVVFLTVVGSNGFAIAATAQDPNDPSKGLKFGSLLNYSGPPGQAPSPSNVEPLAVTKANVLGVPRVFVAGPVNYLANCTTRHSGLQFESFTVDPNTLALTSAGTFPANLPEGNDSCLHFVDITAGRFSKADHDQLLVAYGVDQGTGEFSTGTVKVIGFDLNDQGIAVQQPTIYDSGATPGTSDGGGAAFIRKGRFDWSAPVDQAALMVANCFGCTHINSAVILKMT